MPILYGCVIKDGELQGDSPSNKVKLREAIMNKILKTVSPSNHRQTLQQKNVQFHYKKENEIIIFCVSTDETKKRVCWSFIEEIESGLKIKKKNFNFLKKIL